MLGLDVVGDVSRLRPRIGIVFGGERGLYWRLSGRDNLQYLMVQDFLRRLDGVRVHRVVTRQPTLEDAYVKLVGQDALTV